MDTNKLIYESAEEIGKYIKERIESSLSPMHLLTIAVEHYGKPVLNYKEPFRVGESCTDECYGVYVDNEEKSLGICVPGNHGTLKTLEQNNETKEVFGSDAMDYVDYFTQDKEDYREESVRFANHFLRTIDKDLDYEGLKDALMSNVMRSIATTIPYADIVRAYPSEEVGRFHNDYDGQCYIEDCRNDADKADAEEEERESNQ